MIVIARGAKRATAIQLDCFVVPQSGTSRNDRIRRHALELRFPLVALSVSSGKYLPT
jgi:hypothetical protein